MCQTCSSLRTFALAILGSRMFFPRYLLLLSPPPGLYSWSSPDEAAMPKTAHRDPLGLPDGLVCYFSLRSSSAVMFDAFMHFTVS